MRVYNDGGGKSFGVVTEGQLPTFELEGGGILLVYYIIFRVSALISPSVQTSEMPKNESLLNGAICFPQRVEDLLLQLYGLWEAISPFGGLLEQESGDEVKKGDKSKRGEDKPYRKFEDFENPPILCDSASATRLMKTLIGSYPSLYQQPASNS